MEDAHYWLVATVAFAIGGIATFYSSQDSKPHPRLIALAAYGGSIAASFIGVYAAAAISLSQQAAAEEQRVIATLSAMREDTMFAIGKVTLAEQAAGADGAAKSDDPIRFCSTTIEILSSDVEVLSMVPPEATSTLIQASKSVEESCRKLIDAFYGDDPSGFAEELPRYKVELSFSAELLDVIKDAVAADIDTNALMEKINYLQTERRKKLFG
ncbi:hypothetical protein [Dongia sp.]|uniref:hypothetical protein n=1 Tax=Dongia sp. TaxID=1977262 RepID=UPI0035AFC82B